MRVLAITGDRSFKNGHPRFELQASMVEELVSLFWGKGSVLPRVPSGHFDVITVQDPFWRGFFAWYISKKKRARLNVQVHTDLSVYAGLKKWIARFILKKADSIRVVSNKIKKQIEAMDVPSPIYTLPVYIDIESFQSINKEPHSRKTILWIGRFEKEKGPEFAIDILEYVRNEGIDAKLIMLGEGSEKESLVKKAGNLPVEFVGWKDPRKYLAVSDVVVSTSHHESFGASIVEALASGVPVVSPDVGIAREAGAIITERQKMPEMVKEVLKRGQQGVLKLSLLNKEEWQREWKKTL